MADSGSISLAVLSVPRPPDLERRYEHNERMLRACIGQSRDTVMTGSGHETRLGLNRSGKADRHTWLAHNNSLISTLDSAITGNVQVLSMSDSLS